MSKVNFLTPKEAEEDYEEYTVEIPEGLTEHFEPSQSVTDEPVLALDDEQEGAVSGLRSGAGGLGSRVG